MFHFCVLIMKGYSHDSSCEMLFLSLTRPSEMAAGDGFTCLACAELVKKGNRRILGVSGSEVTVLWKER